MTWLGIKYLWPRYGQISQILCKSQSKMSQSGHKLLEIKVSGVQIKTVKRGFLKMFTTQQKISIFLASSWISQWVPYGAPMLRFLKKF
jgi:hypothetical protein